MIATISNAMMNIPAWVVWLVGLSCILLWHFWDFGPAIRLTEDRISYRQQLSWTDMEYSRIAAVRYYYWGTSSKRESPPLLELSGDNGDTITINIGMFDNQGNIWIIYDVLKKKAPQAGLRNSPGVFFAYQGATAGS